VYTLIYLYAMSCCSNFIAYISIGMIELVFASGIGTSIYMAGQQNNGSSVGWWISFGCFCFSALLFNCLMFCYWSKVKIAIAVIDATADFIVATKRLIFVTIFYFFISVIAFLVWLGGLVGAVSCNKVT